MTMDQWKLSNVLTTALSAQVATQRRKLLYCHTAVLYVRLAIPSHADLISAPVQLDRIDPTIFNINLTFVAWTLSYYITHVCRISCSAMSVTIEGLEHHFININPLLISSNIHMDYKYYYWYCIILTILLERPQSCWSNQSGPTIICIILNCNFILSDGDILC